MAFTSTTTTTVALSDQTSARGVFERAWIGLIEMRRQQVAQRQYRYLLDCDEGVLSHVGASRADLLRAVQGQL